MTADALGLSLLKRRDVAALHWPDFLVTSVLAAAAGFAGNLFMLSLAAYAVLVIARDAACLLIRSHGHQQRAYRYEFGTGKLEQAANLAIAVVKILVGGWLALSLYAELGAGEPAPTQVEISLYALATFLYTLRCASLAGFNHTPVTPIGRSAKKRLFVAITLQLIITLAALSENSSVIVAALSAGVLLLTLVLIQSGIHQAREAVLDMVDHPPGPATEKQIRKVLQGLDPAYDEIVEVRARRAGTVLFVELTVAVEPHQPIDPVRQRLAELCAKFELNLPGSDIVIRLA